MEMPAEMVETRLPVLVSWINKKKRLRPQLFPKETAKNEQKRTNRGLKMGVGGRGWMGLERYGLVEGFLDSCKK